MHPELDSLALSELVDRLEDLENRRTPVGWKPDDAVMRSAIERRIMQLVSSPPKDEERRRTMRLPCELAVKMRSDAQSVRARTRDLGIGGVFVETSESFAVGTRVELEVRGNGTDEHGLRVSGRIAWRADDGASERGVGISFAGDDSERNERRLRRFIVELLRHRMD